MRGRGTRGPRGDRGFSIVEIIAASTILMVVAISLSNLLVASLAATLVSRQREAAASIASDTLENARALGQAALTTAAGSYTSTCPVVSPSGLAALTPVPVLTSSSFLVPYTTTTDNTTYIVCSIVTPSTTIADTVSVMVTWSSGAKSYLTSTQVGF